MKRGSTLFLKVVLILVALGAFTGLLWFPQTEGRAANLDLVSIYSDPFIIYGYIASIPFFGAFYQAFKLLGHIEKNKVFSPISVRALRNIKYCATTLIGFVALALFYIRFFVNGDDPAGPTVLGILVSFAAAVIAIAAGVFQRLLQKAVDIKSENDLTV